MNLSITDFQKISNGYHNAGDITLTGRGKLDMVNNHVGILKGWNTKSVSAATTLEVKNAFVQALKNAGVDEGALEKVRADLGLPQGESTKGFDLSSLKPLSRTQTREILDRFAGVINQRAGSTVVSNRWDALKASNIVAYQNILARADEVNEKSAATRTAAQRKLAMDILDYGSSEIPSKIRKSGTYRNLPEVDKEKFAKIFAAMLLRGGSDVDSIAAEAMKKVLVSGYGSSIQDEARRDRFKGLALSRPATTDLARIEQDVREAKKESANELKLEFGRNGNEMKELAYTLRTTGGLGFNANKTAEKSTSENFVANLAKDISDNEAFLKEVVAKFGENVKDLGSLELVGKPGCRITELKNGNAELLFTIKAGIGDNRAFEGDCLLRVEVNPKDMTLCDAACEMKLAAKFTAKDEKPVELHKMQILENYKNIAASKGAELDDDEVSLIIDQMAEWDDIKPGQLKNFETWLKDDITNFINKSIRGEKLSGAKRPLEFDEDGVCTQFAKDSYRSVLAFVVSKDGKTGKEGNATVLEPTGNENDATPRCEYFCSILKDKSDRMFISSLMNQATLAPIAGLNSDGVLDPDDPSENPARIIGLEPEESSRIPHWSTLNENDLMAIDQPRTNDGWRFELKVDDKNKTATLILKADYAIRPSPNMRSGELGEDRATKVGLHVTTCEFQITGLGSGNPQIASLGVRQDIEAEEM